MEVVNINNDNIRYEDVKNTIYMSKVVLYKDNKILIENNDNKILLPGNNIYLGETIINSLQRKLINDLGIYYDYDTLICILIINKFKKIYKEDEILNNKYVTYYYLGKYKDMNLDKINKLYKNSNKSYELIDINDIENNDEEISKVIKKCKKII